MQGAFYQQVPLMQPYTYEGAMQNVFTRENLAMMNLINLESVS